MKHYIQITAGRGPVECARVVTLVARELLKVIPSIQLADCEPHNQEEGCFHVNDIHNGRTNTSVDCK